MKFVSLQLKLNQFETQRFITIKQCKTALILIKSLGYSLSNVFGHGEVSTNKQATEGKKCKTYATKYWDTPEDELPGGNDKEDKEEGLFDFLLRREKKVIYESEIEGG